MSSVDIQHFFALHSMDTRTQSKCLIQVLYHSTNWLIRSNKKKYITEILKWNVIKKKWNQNKTKKRTFKIWLGKLKIEMNKRKFKKKL